MKVGQKMGKDEIWEVWSCLIHQKNSAAETAPQHKSMQKYMIPMAPEIEVAPASIGQEGRCWLLPAKPAATVR